MKNQRILAVLLGGVAVLVVTSVAEYFGLEVSEEIAEQINLEVANKVEAALTLLGGLIAGWLTKRSGD
jgi:CHASE3 domain sensor protein